MLQNQRTTSNISTNKAVSEQKAKNTVDDIK